MVKILLVEDNEMNRDMLLRRLQRRGFDVSVAVDGAESIERVRSEAPDLVLMDMGLPVMDGYQATRILKEDPATRRIPVLGLSAHAMTGDAAKAMEAGCDDYDTKPVELRRLLSKIEALLERSAAHHGRSAGASPQPNAPRPAKQPSEQHATVPPREHPIPPKPWPPPPPPPHSAAAEAEAALLGKQEPLPPRHRELDTVPLDPRAFDDETALFQREGRGPQQRDPSDERREVREGRRGSDDE